jgi:hypothetical protein
LFVVKLFILQFNPAGRGGCSNKERLIFYIIIYYMYIIIFDKHKLAFHKHKLAVCKIVITSANVVGVACF